MVKLKTGWQTPRLLLLQLAGPLIDFSQGHVAQMSTSYEVQTCEIQQEKKEITGSRNGIL
jgi:hypothetical protein